LFYTFFLNPALSALARSVPASYNIIYISRSSVHLLVNLWWLYCIFYVIQQTVFLISTTLSTDKSYSIFWKAYYNCKLQAGYNLYINIHHIRFIIFGDPLTRVYFLHTYYTYDYCVSCRLNIFYSYSYIIYVESTFLNLWLAVQWYINSLLVKHIGFYKKKKNSKVIAVILLFTVYHGNNIKFPHKF